MCDPTLLPELLAGEALGPLTPRCCGEAVWCTKPWLRECGAAGPLLCCPNPSAPEPSRCCCRCRAASPAAAAAKHWALMRDTLAAAAAMWGEVGGPERLCRRGVVAAATAGTARVAPGMLCLSGARPRAAPWLMAAGSGRRGRVS